MIIRSDETADIATPSGSMRLHLFRPAVPGKFPGVLLFSEIYQVTDPIRRLAAMVAGQGFLVAVPEVYHEYEAPGTVLHYDKPGTDRGNALKTTKAIAAFDEDAPCRACLPAGARGLHRHAGDAGGLPRRPSRLSRGARSLGVGGGPVSTRPTSMAARSAPVAMTACAGWMNSRPRRCSCGGGRTRTCRSRAGRRYGRGWKRWARAYEWHEVNAQHAFLAR